MKRFNFTKIISAGLLCVLFAGCETVDNAPPVSFANQATNAPENRKYEDYELAWRLLDGRKKWLAKYRGKAIVLDFWATYCPPCEEEIPHLVALHEKHEKDGLLVVGLHVGGADDKPKIIDFVKKYRMTYELAYPDKPLMDFYLQGDTAIPQTFVFDRNGELVEKFVGFSPEIKVNLDNAVQKALSTN